MNHRVERLGARVTLAGRALHGVSPLATLDRGYAIVTDAAGGIVTEAAQLAAGDRIEARLASGSLRATVDEVLAKSRGKDDDPAA